MALICGRDISTTTSSENRQAGSLVRHALHWVQTGSRGIDEHISSA